MKVLRRWKQLKKKEWKERKLSKANDGYGHWITATITATILWFNCTTKQITHKKFKQNVK
jgi:hypothetical protein